MGVGELLDHVTEGFPLSPDEAEEGRGAIKVAIIGRPNVGKSTLLNTLVGQERTIVSPVAGTTRDAVDETLHRDGTDYVFVDTAGTIVSYSSAAGQYSYAYDSGSWYTSAFIDSFRDHCYEEGMSWELIFAASNDKVQDNVNRRKKYEPGLAQDPVALLNISY